MGRKALVILKPGNSPEKLKGLEDKTLDAELDCDWEGGSTFYIQDKVVVNAKGDYVLKRGKRHVLNLSEYLAGEEPRVSSIRVYSAS